MQYDRYYVLMDSDIPLNDKARKLQKQHNIQIIWSEPLCLEGMLLDALGQKTPASSQACKKALHPQLAGHPARRESYGELFDRPFLDATTKAQLIELRQLLKNEV